MKKKKKKSNQRRGAGNRPNKQPRKKTRSSLAQPAAKFTDEQKAAMIEAARFAFAEPKPEPGGYDFRADFLEQLTKSAQRRAAKETGQGHAQDE